MDRLAAQINHGCGFFPASTRRVMICDQLIHWEELMNRNAIVLFTSAVIVLVIFVPIGLGQQQTAKPSPFLPLQVSTVPSNGDTTPYGLAFVPDGFPDSDLISTGTLLVSNFNSSSTPGQGTTIIIVNPNSGKTGLFF